MWYGFIDALWQTFAYYTMGAMSNDPRKLAYYAGFYKSIQAVGSTIIAALDANKYPYVNLFASSWALMAGALLCALPVYIWRIKDTEISDADLISNSDYEKDGLPTMVPNGPMGAVGVGGETAEFGDHVPESTSEKI
jgi:hypothetical protein